MRSPTFHTAQDAVSVVMGASRGLGLAFASALLARSPGAVVACSRNGSAELSALAAASGGRLTMVQCDVTDAPSLAAMACHVSGVHGPKNVDLLLNVAGILHEGDRMPERALKEVDPAWMKRVLEVNAMGPILTTQALHRQFRKGAVVGSLSARVGSIGDNGLGGWWSYRMSKAALNMGVRNTALEMRRNEVYAVALHPGTTDTGLSMPFQKNVKPGKLFTVEYTVNSLLDVCQNLKPEDSGGFFAYDGSTIEW